MQCRREACARYRRQHPPRPLTDEQRLRRNKLARIRRATPEGKAKHRVQN